jgi:hypothetical protein
MIYWIVGALDPAMPHRWRLVAALVTCFAVEFSQIFQSDWLQSVRSTLVGHLVLGSDFDPRDLVSYGVGVACASFADQWLKQ